ncbi:SERF family protein [Carpediemonas membranifera]|uniref:SERF family protein n=1 Tax=Carpediemonas membranifera TaxID=201153 RepID=A0A8J6B3V0_9EUKA|nr:SERF family protein [Carpediemonas membranifera]|eukprot:KAG9393739.1 SERF family protein [Carpediemonas membranifera]
MCSLETFSQRSQEEVMDSSLKDMAPSQRDSRDEFIAKRAKMLADEVCSVLEKKTAETARTLCTASFIDFLSMRDPSKMELDKFLKRISSHVDAGSQRAKLTKAVTQAMLRQPAAVPRHHRHSSSKSSDLSHGSVTPSEPSSPVGIVVHGGAAHLHPKVSPSPVKNS